MGDRRQVSKHLGV